MKVAKLCKNRHYRYITVCAYKEGVRVCKRVGWHWQIEQWMAELHGADWLENKLGNK